MIKYFLAKEYFKNKIEEFFFHVKNFGSIYKYIVCILLIPSMDLGGHITRILEFPWRFLIGVEVSLAWLYKLFLILEFSHRI